MAPKRSAVTPSSASHTPATTAQATNPTPSKSAIVTPSRSAISTPSKATPQDAQAILQSVLDRYQEQTPQRVKLIDAFMGFLLVVGALQFVYCLIVGNFPFNAFLSGFSATVGQFVLTASLRMQTNPANKDEFAGSDERAFADYVFGSLVLHFFCVNFIN